MTSEERERQGLQKLREIAGDQAGNPLNDWNAVAPDMRRYIVEFIAGDILSRPGLDAKSRQLATVAMLAAMDKSPEEFKMHLGGALRLGWMQEELVEVILQTAVFAGFPAALHALKAAAEVFSKKIQPNPTPLEQAQALVAEIQAADAAMNTDRFLALLAPDVTLRIGSQPELHGQNAVRQAIDSLFGMMARIQHTTRNLWLEGDRVLLEAQVEFQTKAGKVVTLPYFNALRLRADGLVADYRIHIDLAPLFAAGTAA